MKSFLASAALRQQRVRVLPTLPCRRESRARQTDLEGTRLVVAVRRRAWTAVRAAAFLNRSGPVAYPSNRFKRASKVVPSDALKMPGFVS